MSLGIKGTNHKMAENLRHIFTSESVTEGHPDKMADQVSDAVLDAVLKDDPTGRVACEVLVTTGICVVAGEITTTTYVDVPKLAREVINEIGFNNAAYGFDGKTCAVSNMIQSQSPDIAMACNRVAPVVVCSVPPSTSAISSWRLL